MKMPEHIDAGMVAPCGVICLACGAYLNKKSPCAGCRALDEEHMRKSCRACAKKKCAFDQGLTWCFECARFPCARIKSLNARYVQNYDVDLVQNGRDARENMDAFLAAQRARFTCGLCGGVIDQHHRRCGECGAPVKTNP